MKTQIAFRKTDGSDGVALVNGDASSAQQAKHELAAALSFQVGKDENIDQVLKRNGIDPDSIKPTHISE